MSALSNSVSRTKIKESREKQKNQHDRNGKPKRRIVIKKTNQKEVQGEISKPVHSLHPLHIHKSFDEDSQTESQKLAENQRGLEELEPLDIQEELYNSSGSERSTPREEKHLSRKETKILVLSFDAEEIKTKLVKKDPELKRIFDRVKLDFKEIVRPPYVALVGAVIGQKIKYPLAKKIREALFTSLGTNFTPEDIKALPDSQLIKFGVSRAKIQIIRDASAFIEEKRLTLSTEEEIRSLTKVKGIKEWTVTNILLVTMANLNLFPPNDVWMERKIREIYGKTSLSVLLRRWSPYASIVAWHLWR